MQIENPEAMPEEVMIASISIGRKQEEKYVGKGISIQKSIEFILEHLPTRFIRENADTHSNTQVRL